MQIHDLINGVFEALGGLFILSSVFKLAREKLVKGVHWLHIGFFTSWGFWNLFYYPALDQWFSFWGGLGLMTVNTLYLGQIVHYSRLRNRHVHTECIRAGDCGTDHITCNGYPKHGTTSWFSREARRCPSD